MFVLNSKKKKKEKIDTRISNLMHEYSDETEKSYRKLIRYSAEDFPDEGIRISGYGIFKARLGTNLMIAAGGNVSKLKLDFGGVNDFFNDIQLASAIAYKPFSEINSKEYFDKSIMLENTERITKYLLEILKKGSNKVYDLDFNENDEVFKKVQIYFYNCIAESTSNKATMEQIIQRNQPFFNYITSQNLKIMSEFMNL